MSDNAAPAAPSTPEPVTESAPETPGSPPSLPDEGAGTGNAGEAAKSAEAVAKRWKLKIDGKEEELDEKTVLTYAQKGKAADKRLEEATKKERMAQSFLDAIRKDPLGVLTHQDIGFNFDEIAEKHLISKYQREQMSPEQRELLEARSKLEAYESEKKTYEQKVAEDRQHKADEAVALDLDKTFSQALKASGLPKTPVTVKRMAALMLKNLELGLDLAPDQVVELVREDMQVEIRELLSSADGEMLMKLLGDEPAKRLRQYDLARVRGKPGTTPARESSGNGEQPRKMLTKDEWKALLDKRTAG